MLGPATTRSVLTISSFTKQDVGLYTCSASNEMNKAGDKEDGLVYVNMETGRLYITCYTECCVGEYSYRMEM